MIQYGQYAREDGVQCSAVLYSGNVGSDQDGPDHVFEILEILNAADLKAYWVDAEKTDELELDERGEPQFDDDDELIWKIIPEHVEIEASKDKLFPGDYIVMRDGDTYVQDGRLFEAVWSTVDTTLTDLGEFLQSRQALTGRPKELGQ